MLTVSRAWHATKGRTSPVTMHRLADKAAPRFVKAFRAPMIAWQAQVSLDVLGESIRAHDTDRIAAHLDLNAVPKRIQGLTDATRQLYYQARELQAAEDWGALLHLPVSKGAQPAKVPVSFTLTNPRAIAWARKKAAQLVTAVSDSTREVIREIIARALAEGIPPEAAARLIRSSIGLTARQAGAVVRYQTELEAAGKDAAAVQRAVDRYARQLLNQRARLIARTETIAASQAGQLEVWKQNRERGLLEANQQRKWIVTHDDRLDEAICAPMDGQIVGLDDEFIGGDGSTAEGPPIHPGCRVQSSAGSVVSITSDFDSLGRAYTRRGPKPSPYTAPPIMVRLSAEERGLVRHLASEQATSMSDVLREALALYAERHRV